MKAKKTKFKFESILTASLLVVVLGGMGLSGTVWKKGDPFPYQIPMLRYVVIASSVSVNNSDYVYSYTIVNSSANSMPISWFYVGRDPHVPINLDLKRIAPEGWELPPAIGTWGTYPDDPTRRMIKPGRSLSGFILISTSPPGITNFMVEGYDPNWESFVRSLSAQQYDQYANSPDFGQEFWKYRKFSGKTIFPMVPPEPCMVSAWAARMLSDAEEARKLGWIQTDEQSARIKELIKALNTDNKKRLKKAVGEIEQYVLSEKKAGRLTDEADALARLNAEYLLHRVEQDPKILKRK